MDSAISGMGYDILTTADLFSRSCDEICMRVKIVFTQKI